MERYEQFFDYLLSSARIDASEIAKVRRYVIVGDERTLRQIHPLDRSWFSWVPLTDLLPAPNALREVDARVIQALVALNVWVCVANWLDEHLKRERPADDFTGVLASVLQEVGYGADAVTRVLATMVKTFSLNGQPSSAGRYLLALPDRDFRRAMEHAVRAEFCPNSALIRFVAEAAPDRVVVFAGGLSSLIRNRCEWVSVVATLMATGNRIFEPSARRAFREERMPYNKFQIGVELEKIDTDCREEVLRAALDSLAGDDASNNHACVCKWMVTTFGTRMVPDIAAYLRRTHYTAGYAKPAIISDCVLALGEDALPVVMAGLEAGGDTPYAALSQLIGLAPEAHFETIRYRIEEGLRGGATDAVIRYIGLAARWNAAAVQDSLWKLAEDKSKPVREAAARALGTVGNDAIERSRKLLGSNKAANRLSAVSILSAVGTPEALNVLEGAVETEGTDDVRESMFAALYPAWKASGKAVSMDAVERRAVKMAEAGWKTALWMSKISIPEMLYTDGSPVPLAVTVYALARQEGMSEIKPPAELLPFYERIDRRTSSDFALAVLRGFAESGADAKHKWAVAIAGLLGDDRIVSEISSLIRAWVDSGRGKLAEYAVHALTLLNTDRALLSLDSLALRYRNKMKNVGSAAVGALAAAAESRGMSVEELGDKVVPDLGFGADRTRTIDCGGREIRLTLGTDFRLSYFDVQQGKKLGSLPSSAPADVKAEFKEFSALLRDVAKAQTRRLEMLMVQQRRWPVAEWKRLFLEQPLLIPFGVRLVWGEYSSDGDLGATFRALEDKSLVFQSSEFVQLTDASTVGIIHPLEIDESLWLRWMDHLTNYGDKPPFPQLDRPVASVEPENAARRFYYPTDDTSMNGMTFKGRAERLGWRRGSVCDAGMITAYVKSYPAAGVDAFVELEDMYVGIDVNSDIKVCKAYFVKHGSVKIGSYEYDEPQNESDSRLIAFANVPRIVYSETMGDLQLVTRPSQIEAD